jgi:purine nucleosidase
MKPVILEVDTGIDDALAIAYALNSPEIELIGLTTCFGKYHSQYISSPRTARKKCSCLFRSR